MPLMPWLVVFAGFVIGSSSTGRWVMKAARYRSDTTTGEIEHPASERTQIRCSKSLK